jgi:dolichyl-phosphate-mannose-protein mannosyltransferase
MSCLVAGVAVNFVFSDTVNFPVSFAGPRTRRRAPLRAKVPLRMVVGCMVVIAAVIGGFVFTAPLTYGSPGLSVEAVGRRRILDSWTLHFAK